MARLRWAVPSSDWTSDSSIRSSLPASREKYARIFSTRSSTEDSAPLIIWFTAIAPALIMGLAGRCVSSSSEIALNASPDGSTPTYLCTSAAPSSSSASAYTNGLEIDWMVNSYSSSPTEYRFPEVVHSATPSLSGSATASSSM